jgi:hypothetical protein
VFPLPFRVKELTRNQSGEKLSKKKKALGWRMFKSIHPPGIFRIWLTFPYEGQARKIFLAFLFFNYPQNNSPSIQRIFPELRLQTNFPSFWL